MNPQDPHSRPGTVVTALVADDEEAPREQLLAALHQAWPALQVVAVERNGVDAWDAFLEHEPDLCFLDIRMPGLSGIDVARRIGGQAAVVFVTAHGEHALAAFDSGAVDPTLDNIGRILAASRQPLAQRCDRRRQYENPDHAREQAAHLPRALPVDLEQDVGAGPGGRIHGIAGRPVIIAMYFGRFEEFTGGAADQKIVDRGEIVFAAMLLAGARRARGV